MRRRWFPGLTALAAVLTGCGSLAEVAPPTPSPVALPAGAVYGDDFSAPGSGWPVSSGDGYSTGYTHAGTRSAYEIKANGSTVVRSPAPANSLPAAVRAEVDIAETGPGRDSHIGVDCRYAGTDYVLQVGADGYFGILELQGETLVADLADSLGKGPSSAVKDPPAVNHVSATCAPAAAAMTLSLSVNGSLVATATASFPDAAASTAARATPASTPPPTAALQVILRDEPGSQPSDALFSHLILYRA
jgi:hypothetical protein